MNRPASTPPSLLDSESDIKPNAGNRSTSLLLLILIAVGVTWLAGVLYQRFLIEERRTAIDREVTESANRLRATILDRLSLLDSLETLVVSRQQLDRITAVFPSFARGLSSANPGIAYLFLAPDFEVGSVFPPTVGGVAAGLDLTDPQWPDRTAVLQTLSARRIAMTDSRPFENGGLGLRAYKAITVGGQVWGAAGIAIDLSRLLELARIGTGASDMQYAIRNVNGTMIAGAAAVFDNEPVSRRLNLPGTHWELAAAPVLSWHELVSAELLMFRGYVLVLILLLSVVAWFLFSREHWMSEVVDERTRELDRSNAKLRDEVRERRQFEQNLRERESLLRITLEQTSAGIAQLRLDGRLFNINPAFAQMLGYAEHELLNQDIRMLVADPRAIENDLEAVHGPAGQTTVERQLLNRDKLPVWLHISLALARPSGNLGAYYVAVCQDVSAQKFAAQASRRSEDLARRLFAELPTPSLLLAADSGEIVAANRAADALLDADRDNVTEQIIGHWSLTRSQPTAAASTTIVVHDGEPAMAKAYRCRITVLVIDAQTRLLCSIDDSTATQGQRTSNIADSARIAYLRDLQNLTRIGSAPGDMADTLVRQVSDHFAGRTIALFAFDAIAAQLSLLASVGPGSTSIVSQFSRYQLNRDDLAALSAEPRRVDNRRPKFSDLAAALRESGLHATQLRPLRLDDAPAGLLLLADAADATETHGDALTPAMLEDVDTACDAASAVLGLTHLAEILDFYGSTDRAELRQSATALRDTASRYHKMATRSAHCLWLADAKGALIEVNPAWCQLSGLAHAASLGHGWVQACVADRREQFLDDYQRLIRTGKRFDLQLTLVNKGESRQLLLNAEPLFDAREQIEGWTLAGTERIAESNALHDARTRSTELLAFSRSMSHDLHGPLRSIHGFAQSILEECNATPGSRCRDYAERLTRSAKRLGRLVEDLLAYTRMQGTDIQTGEVSLDDVVEQVVNQLEADIAATGATVTIERPLHRAFGHHATLVAVVSNFVSNALKFTRDNDTPQVRISTETDTDGIRLWVADRGIGIAEDDLNRIFQPFERLHSQDEYPGSGLGLSLVAEAMRRMGGTTGVEAGETGGSRFWLHLRSPVSGGDDDA